MSTDTLTVEGSGHECDAKLSLWLKDLLPLTPGCMPSVRKRALILACREFFSDSAAWRVTVGPRQLVANKKRYYMSPYDAYSNVVHVFAVWANGSYLRSIAARPPSDEPAADNPRGWWLEQPDQVRLWPASATTVDNALLFYVALTPKPTVSHLPRIAATHFYDAIFDGTLGRLYQQPAKPYSNPERATYHLNRFRAAIGNYAGQAKKNFSNASTWMYPSFGK